MPRKIQKGRNRDLGHPNTEHVKKNSSCILNGVSSKILKPDLFLTFTGFLSVLVHYHFLRGSEVKVPAWNAGDLGLIPGLGRSPGEGNGNPLQYSCLENPMEGGAWWAIVHGVAKSRTRLSDKLLTTTTLLSYVPEAC